MPMEMHWLADFSQCFDQIEDGRQRRPNRSFNVRNHFRNFSRLTFQRADVLARMDACKGAACLFDPDMANVNTRVDMCKITSEFEQSGEHARLQAGGIFHKQETARANLCQFNLHCSSSFYKII